MSQPMAVLEEVEAEIAALLIAGLARQRGSQERLEELAGSLSALKLERLAAELRNLSREQDPRALAGSAFTALATVRKLQERLLPWAAVESDGAVPLAGNPTVRTALPDSNSVAPDISTLAEWMETGDGLIRAHAAALLLDRGAEAIPELSRLASKGPVAIRRESVAALGRIGDIALETLASLLGDVHCWRQLREAILSSGRQATPCLAAILAEEKKKGRETRRYMAAALLYRLGEYGPLRSIPIGSDEDPVLSGFAIAARARADGGWTEPAGPAGGAGREPAFVTSGIVAVARAEVTGDVGALIESLDGGSVNDVRAVARWAASGSAVECALADHYLAQLSAGRSKDRNRAASALCGLAPADLLPRLAEVADTEPSVADVVAEIGGSHAVGILLDLLEGNAAAAAFKGLQQLGDPDSAPALLDMLWTSRNASTAELVLVALGDGAVEFLGREMRERQGTPQAGRIQQVLLQMKGPRARRALQGTDPDSAEALLARLDHPKLGEGAAKELAQRGESMLDQLAQVVAGAGLMARLNALDAIAAIKGPRSVGIIKDAVARSIQNARNNAESMLCVRGLGLLAKLEGELSAPLFASGLSTGTYNVQEVSMRALVKTGAGAIPLVMPLLGSSDPSVRAKAIETLGKLRAAEAEERAIAMLSDSSNPVRISATAALGSIAAETGSQRSVDALGASLFASTGWWHGVVISALVETRHRAAIAHLRRYAKEVDPKDPANRHLRVQAEAAIKKIEATAERPPQEGLVGRLRGLLRG